MQRGLLLALFVALCVPASAFDNPICGRTCEPDPTSSTYGATVQARVKAYNTRGKTAVLAIPAAGSKNTSATEVLAGSESYSYAVPILALPGRSGLDVALTLHYSSRIWTINKSNGTATLNADRDFPSYGFRLGYGYLEHKADLNLYIVTLADGSKHQLSLVTTGIYDAADSSFMRYASTDKVLRFKDGTRIHYEVFPNASTLFRPIKIQDSNGNYISISYLTDSWASGHEISQITDTLGRQIAFNYDPNNYTLTSITHLAAEGTRTFSFTWNTSYTLNYNFSLTVNDSPQSGSTQKVLTGIIYPNGTRYSFVYGSWGIVKRIEQRSANDTLRSSVEYDYPGTSSALSDHPTFAKQMVSESGGTPAEWQYLVTKSGGIVTSTTITAPDGTKTKTALSEGLISSVTITAPGQSNPLRTISYVWGGTPESNPRISSVTTTLNDSNQSSKVEYFYTTFGNVSEVKEYDYGLILRRRVQTDYLTHTDYTAQRILNRPLQIRVYDQAGALKARTDFAYDYGTPVTPSGTVPNHDTANFPDSYTKRGNLTSIKRYQDAAGASGAITRNFTYDILGNMRTADLDCCSQRTWVFDSNTAWAYPVEVASGSGVDQITEEYGYDVDVGVPISFTDANGRTTAYQYDTMNRWKGSRGRMAWN